MDDLNTDYRSLSRELDVLDRKLLSAFQQSRQQLTIEELAIAAGLTVNQVVIPLWRLIRLHELVHEARSDTNCGFNYSLKTHSQHL